MLRNCRNKFRMFDCLSPYNNLRILLVVLKISVHQEEPNIKTPNIEVSIIK